MAATDPKVDAFLSRTGTWADETATLRALLLDAGLEEALKWGKPCYARGGKNVAIIQGFKDFCAVLFFKGVLMDDPAGLLRSQGPNTQGALRIELSSLTQIEAAEPEIRALIAEAIRVEDAGLAVAYAAKDDLDYPDELVDAFDADPDLRAAFEALTPGRKRSWIMHFTEAKQAATRTARIARAATSIHAGKGVNGR